MTGWLPSLNALRAFDAVARHLSYQSAAEELHVSPAAVKQLVSKLEDALGTPLFVRAGRGLAITRAGRAGQEDVGKAMHHLAASVEKMRNLSQKQRLIVTVESSLATTWLVPKLAGFKARHPQIDVLINSSQEIVDLHRGDADVAIRYGVPERADLITHRLFDDAIFPACSPALAKGPPTIRNLDDLVSVPLIHWDISHLQWAHSTRKWFVWDRWLERVGMAAVNTEGSLYFSDYGQAVQAAIAGQGMVLASWPILRDAVEANLLVCPFREKVTTDIGYDLVTTPRAQKRPEVQQFITWVLEISGREKP
jgi:LysR family glycine cleavage system transcriptional activator